MTFDDLDALRNHRIRGPFATYHMAQTNTNRRYLILTYTVEFDRIHYPLPLEYCGPPDPQILQQHIARLEDEIVLLKNQTKHPAKNSQENRIISLQKRDASLKRMSDDTGARVKSRSVSPRACRSESWETQQPNLQQRSTRLKSRRKSRSDSDASACYTSPTNFPSTSIRATKHKEPCHTSRSGSASSRCSSSSPKRETYNQTIQRSSPKGNRSKIKNEFDFGELENRIQAVQKMLHEGLALP